VPGSARAAAAEIAELPNARMWVLAGPDAPDPDAHQMPVWGPSLEEARASAALRAAED
jgi:hypothetical protein